MNEQVQEFLRQATQSIQSGQAAQALDLANQAIVLDPGNAEAYLLKGVALAQTGQSDQATEAFQSAIRLEPYNAKARYNLSVHFYGLGMKRESLNEALAALNAEPGHAAAREMVQRVESELGLSSTSMPDPVIPNVPPATAAGVTPLGQPTGAPSPDQNPYAQNPYGAPQPGQPAPYYRSPYEQQPGGPGSAHSVAFVEQMGEKWTTIGWIIGAVGLGVAVISMITSWSQLSTIFSSPEAMERASNSGAMMGNPVLSVIGLLLTVACIGWTCIDISDRRGNWVWLVPLILCCCCGLPYGVQLVYMAAGRNK